ncbi:ChaN family lipoprotein [Actibacterium sp. XHP0104]|uniref:ChaN family lipoprotein n=1 Tax=Actibacterium sp. XHP0104 TaxID=2984335 RepID=UPI0021E81474|nr:ChaN family lipoprotein [Actibacterium sp. XHP0104]MCV2882679.1 ChaN family lipoprotein [Actibacterium sp. XHP0104]
MRKLALMIAALVPLPLWGGQIDADDLRHLPRADVVVLGEVHDNPVHHENQAAAVASIAPAALVFEMLDAAQAARITPALRGDADALGAELGWADSGWPDFALYYPIMAAVPQARIYGGAVPRADVRRSVSEGAAAVMGGDAAAYGLDLALPAEQQAAREALQQEAHCNALPPDLLPGMVQAQRLRDAALALAVDQALRDTGGPVAVITGNGHARTDWGLPAALRLVRADVSLLAVGQFETDPGADAPYDLWLITAPAEREDPCAGFTR